VRSRSHGTELAHNVGDRTTAAQTPAIMPLHTMTVSGLSPDAWLYHRSSMTRWREVVTLYTYEIRSALRDRTIVINSIVIPMVLYPAMLWIMFTGIEFVRGQTADQTSRISIVGLTGAHPDLDRSLHRTPRLEIVPGTDAPSSPERLVTTGALDAVLEFQPAPATGFPDNLRARIILDASRERSETAGRRVRDALRLYRERRLREEAFARGVTAAEWAAFALDQRNVASSDQMGRSILGLMLPLFFVVMVAVGCFYPAIDSTAGERERGTWETLMTTPAARSSIVAAKYLSVTTFGCMAGLLNVAAILLTLGGILAPLAGQANAAVSFRVPLAALPVLAAGALLLAGFVAAGMMVFAAFARTFREGQTLVQPFYLAVLLPTLFLGSRDTELTLGLAAVPIVNIALVTRQALMGIFHGPYITLAAAVSLAAIAVLVRVATAIIESEDVMVGSYRGTFATFLRDRLRGAAPRGGAR
jgi:sodium transport system permease protein